MSTSAPGGVPAGGRFSLCGPALAGTAAGAVTGLAVWALVSFIPAFHDGVPQPVTDVLPFALAWAGHTLTAWIVPHQAAPGAVIPTRTEPSPVIQHGVTPAEQVTWMRDQITSGITTAGADDETVLEPPLSSGSGLPPSGAP